MALFCGPDHAAADHLRLEADLVDGTYDADRVGRIGAHDDDVGVGRLDRADDRRVIRGRRRIGLVVDDLQAVLLGVLRAPSEALRENSWSAATIATVVGFGFCAIATSKKPCVNAGFGSGPDGIIAK